MAVWPEIRLLGAINSSRRSLRAGGLLYPDQVERFYCGMKRAAVRSQRNKIKSFDTVLPLRQVTEFTLPRKGMNNFVIIAYVSICRDARACFAAFDAHSSD